MSILRTKSPLRPPKITLLHSENTPTLRSLTGPEIAPSSPVGIPSPKYERRNILVFRSASGQEQTLPPARTYSPPPEHSSLLTAKPRISSVTDSAAGSPDSTQPNLDRTPLTTSTVTTDTPNPELPDDDTGSTYSHASAINLDDLDDDDIAGLRCVGLDDRPLATRVTRQILERNRQSFANSFARAQMKKTEKKAMVLARPELQPHNNAQSLVERCIRAFSEALDMNLIFATQAGEKFSAFSALFTREERMIVGELLKEASTRLKVETPTPWRSPLNQIGTKRLLKLPMGTIDKNSIPKGTGDLINILKGGWTSGGTTAMQDDTIVRAVVFGSHVNPGAQNPESMLLRMLGEFQREEVNRKASRAERLDIPLSFAMTLSGTLATLSRLECHTSYKKYRSRSAANRKGNPQAMLIVKTKYDGLKLSFVMTLHGESPCTVLFRRPRIFSQRKIDDYANLVTEMKDVLTEFAREIARGAQ